MSLRKAVTWWKVRPRAVLFASVFIALAAGASLFLGFWNSVEISSHETDHVETNDIAHTRGEKEFSGVEDKTQPVGAVPSGVSSTPQKGPGSGETAATSPSQNDPFGFFTQENAALMGVPFRPPLPARDISRNCAGFSSHATLQDLFKPKKGPFAFERFGDAEFVSEWTQFWRRAGEFFQLKAKWEMNTPATYRLELFRGTTPSFEDGLPDIGLLKEWGLAAQDSLPLGLVFHAVEAGLERALNRGAVLGSRLVKVLRNRSQPGFEELTFEDSRVIALRTKQMTCAPSNGDKSAAACSCREGSGS